jgi:hypothetical protein
MKAGFRGGGVFRFELWRPYGKARDALRAGNERAVREFYENDRQFHERIWFEEDHNIVVNEGLQHILDVTFAACAQVTTWHVGLINSAAAPSIAAADTLASHAGWTENTSYDGNRKEFVDVRTAQAVTNSASIASFSINTASNIHGGFLSEPSTGTSGVLLSGVAFASNKSASDGDTLEVTYSFSAADDGA